MVFRLLKFKNICYGRSFAFCSNVITLFCSFFVLVYHQLPILLVISVFLEKSVKITSKFLKGFIHVLKLSFYSSFPKSSRVFKSKSNFHYFRFNTTLMLWIGVAYRPDLRQSTECKFASVASRWQLVLIWLTKKLNPVSCARRQECLLFDHLSSHRESYLV